jgi:glutathione S-transferase
MSGSITLVTRRTIRASASRLFDAWTQPEQLRAWWGPRPVTCAGAEVDLRVGGRYRIDNVLPDGQMLTIEGEFQVVEAPRSVRE